MTFTYWTSVVSEDSEDKYWFNGILEVDDTATTAFSDYYDIVRLCLEFGFEDTIYQERE